MNRFREVLIRLFAKINHYIVARQWYLGTFYIYVCRLIDVINNYRHSQEIFEWSLKDFGVRPYSMGHTEPDILIKKLFLSTGGQFAVCLESDAKNDNVRYLLI